MAVVGLGYVIRTSLSEGWSLVNGFCAYFLAPYGLGRTDLKKYGSWAGRNAITEVQVGSPFFH